MIVKQDILDEIDARIAYLNAVSGKDTQRQDELERLRAFVDALVEV